MGASSIPVIGICRLCFLRGYQRRHLATSANASARPVPLRIFATENDQDDAYPVFDDDGRSEPSKEEKQQRYEKWLETRNRLVSSNERLATEFRNRVGRHQPAGLLTAAEAFHTPIGTTTLSRSRGRPDSSLMPLVHISPAELLHPQENVEINDTIFGAIEGCISAAVERLELYSSRDDSSTHPKDKITIPHDQYTWLTSILQFQFAKSQLVDYGHKSGLKKTRLLKAKTLDVIKMILEGVWSLEKEPELPPDENLVTKSLQPFCILN